MSQRTASRNRASAHAPGGPLLTPDRWEALFASSAKRTRLRRKWAQGVAYGLSALALALALFPLADLFIIVVWRGIGGLSLRVFAEVTNGVSAGLENAILGTVDLTGLGILLAGTVGIGGGIFLADWSSPRIERVLGYVTDVLAGVPSIVIGYFGYILLVSVFGWGFSLLAGSVSLAVLMLPYVVRTTELAIRRVPGELKEGSLALGISHMATTHQVSFRLAFPSIMTGLLIACGIGVGETAPLLYTAEWSNFNPSGFVHRPVGYLTYVVWTFIQKPFTSAHELAYTAAFLLVAAAFALNLAARSLLGHAPGGHGGLRS